MYLFQTNSLLSFPARRKSTSSADIHIDIGSGSGSGSGCDPGSGCGSCSRFRFIRRPDVPRESQESIHRLTRPPSGQDRSYRRTKQYANSLTVPTTLLIPYPLHLSATHIRVCFRDSCHVAVWSLNVSNGATCSGKNHAALYDLAVLRPRWPDGYS